MNSSQYIDFILNNLKNILFPENFFQLDLKFSKAEIAALMLIRKNGDIIMSEVSEYIDAPMSTVTGIADRLVKSGYVSREHSKSDRRAVILVLTETGRIAADEMLETATEFIDKMFSCLSEDEKQSFISIVQKMLHSPIKLNESVPTENTTINIPIE